MNDGRWWPLSSYRSRGEVYDGDRYQNILGDIITSQVGFVLCWHFKTIKNPWIEIVWFLLSEICLYYYLCDNLIICFLYGFQLIKK